MMKSEQTNIGWAIPGFQSHSIRRSNTDGKKFKAKTQPERTESTIEKSQPWPQAIVLLLLDNKAGDWTEKGKEGKRKGTRKER